MKNSKEILKEPTFVICLKRNKARFEYTKKTGEEYIEK
tara:strand:- start:22229 stop:22342 length:114 start_codon:yes stop_codon:yes gene_type:complete